ncbi:MAG: hypothetical protein ACFFAH_00725 [Promethearchaeota archaeon]
MSLTNIEFINGISCLIYVVIMDFIGLLIATKYTKDRNSNYLYIGTAWILICSPWLAMGLTFLSNIIFLQRMPIALQFIIGYFFLPLGFMLWLLALTNFRNKVHQKPILISFSILEAIFIILFLYGLFFAPDLLGVASGNLEIDYGWILRLFLISHLFLFLITGLIFATLSMRLDNPELRYKGIFLIAAFLAYLIGGLLSIANPEIILILIVARIISIFSGVFFYFGFFLPKALKNKIINKPSSLQL